MRKEEEREGGERRREEEEREGGMKNGEREEKDGKVNECGYKLMV